VLPFSNFFPTTQKYLGTVKNKASSRYRLVPTGYNPNARQLVPGAAPAVAKLTVNSNIALTLKFSN
jgi:hypothetical protein